MTCISLNRQGCACKKKLKTIILTVKKAKMVRFSPFNFTMVMPTIQSFPVLLMKEGIMRLFLLSLLLLFAVACGGQESFSQPMVKSGDIVQSRCISPGKTIPKETMDVSLKGRTITYHHANMLLPRGSVVGIVDRDGAVSWSAALPYYYLEAEEGLINLREIVRYNPSEDMCLYDVTIKITKLSGGEYHFFVYDTENKLRLKVFMDVI